MSETETETEDLEDLDDDDDDDDDDEIDDTEIRMRVDAVRRRQSPPAPPSRPPPSGAMRAYRKEVDDDLAEIMSGLEFGTGAHSVSVYRLEPEIDEETGKQIVGHQQTFHRAITADEIQKRFGGGRYRVTIRGPRANGKGNVYKQQKIVVIAGPPIPLPDPREKRREAEEAKKREADMLSKVLDQAKHREEMLRRELMTAQEKQTDLLLALATKKEDPAAALTPILTMMREEAARRDEQRREDERRREEQLRLEREEQRRRDELAREQQNRQFELQLKQMELQMKASEAQARAVEERMRHEREVQMKMSEQLAEIQRQANETTTNLLMAQLREKDKTKNGIETALEMYRTINEIANPPGEEKHVAEKIFDKVAESAPAVLAGFKSMRVAQPTPPVAPGTVAVVEGHETLPPLPRLDASAAQGEPSTPTPTPNATGAGEGGEERRINPLVDFPPDLAYASEDMQTVIEELVHRLDLAMQKGLDVDEAHAKCIVPLPEAARAFLAGLETEALMDFFTANVPPDWPLCSLAGENMVRMLHKRLST